MFQHVEPYAGDPILTLMEKFQKDERSNKVNLSIGLYYTEEGIVPQLNAVKQAALRTAHDVDGVGVGVGERPGHGAADAGVRGRSAGPRR